MIIHHTWRLISRRQSCGTCINIPLRSPVSPRQASVQSSGTQLLRIQISIFPVEALVPPSVHGGDPTGWVSLGGVSLSLCLSRMRLLAVDLTELPSGAAVRPSLHREKADGEQRQVCLRHKSHVEFQTAGRPWLRIRFQLSQLSVARGHGTWGMGHGGGVECESWKGGEEVRENGLSGSKAKRRMEGLASVIFRGTTTWKRLEQMLPLE